jgi:Zn finger protein HypA/HybF involved in hydrogenase expression
MLENSNDVIEKHVKIEENLIDVSFEEILSDYEVEKDIEIVVETEPLCGSCFAPLEVDEEQTIGYCEKCQTTVFVERRVCNSSFDTE